jgi:hypothetical protein
MSKASEVARAEVEESVSARLSAELVSAEEIAASASETVGTTRGSDEATPSLERRDRSALTAVEKTSEGKGAGSAMV